MGKWSNYDNEISVIVVKKRSRKTYHQKFKLFVNGALLPSGTLGFFKIDQNVWNQFWLLWKPTDKI